LNVKVIIFDLDDTLYNEIDYVKSGFKEVSNFFSQKYDLDEEALFCTMIKNLNLYGRGKVFDNTLSHFNIFSKTNVKKSISLYRKHLPNLNLPKESKKILQYYKALNVPMYLVTDGNKIMQYNKVKGLNIEKNFKKVFITHRYGVKNAKPSPYCFIKIAEEENVKYSEVVYIGDNIKKDFVNIKALGFKTICVKNGMFKNAVMPKKYHAEIEVDNITLIQNILKTGDLK
jgi:putative hydrolase of the HAD superfamily